MRKTDINIDVDRTYFDTFRKLLPAATSYTYLNSGGCGPLATPVLEGMKSVFDYMYQEGQVNVAVHDSLKRLLENVREDVANFIHADTDEIFFVRCIAEGLNTINRMFDYKKGDEILISDQENPASILPCFVLEPELGIHTNKFSGLGNKEEMLDAFGESLTDQTRAVIMSHVFHTTGAAIPAKEMCEKAAERNIITILDGAQAAGNIKIDVKEINCDFYLLSCHKWLCGPEGIAAVYMKKNLIDSMKIPFGGVGMQSEFDFGTNTFTPQSGARRFEYGGRHTPMYQAFSDCIQLANTIGLDNIIKRKEELHRYCRTRFESEIPIATILSPHDERLITGIFSFTLPGMDHQEVVKRAWKEEQMIIQWRTIDLITKEEGIRVSLNWFNTEKEIEKLVKFIKRIME